jgi:hypothetical protein
MVSRPMVIKLHCCNAATREGRNLVSLRNTVVIQITP